MDRTLEEIGDRLHPKHLLDDILGFFRSSGGTPGEYTQITRNVGREVLNKVKQHPLPALLCGAGLAWLLLEGDGQEEPQERKSRRPRREFDHRPEARDAYMEEYMEELDDPYEDWSDTPFYAAWEDEYDWSAAAEDEASWSERAQQAVQEIRATLAAEGLPEKEKMRTLAGKLVGVSGRTREEIHAQWADLPEHSGSVVDARTGQPYEESYGRRWRGLGAAHYASSQDWPEQEDAAWSDKAKSALERMKHALNDAGSSAKEQLRKAAESVEEFVSGTGQTASDLGQKARRRVRQMASASRRGVQQGAERMREGVQDGYAYTRERLEHALVESPLAVGAAVLGLGLIAGLALPSTRREDRWLGQAADDAKRQVRRQGRKAIERGQRAASAVANAAAGEMQQQGITPQSVGQAAQRTVARAVEAVKDELPDLQEAKGKATAVAERSADAARREIQGADRPNRPR
jgi:hypothetical protein